MAYTPITIKDLLDYSRAEEWLGSFYQTAIRCLNDDLELYQLLDLDAEGIDDPEYQQRREVPDSHIVREGFLSQKCTNFLQTDLRESIS
jgi:hypothetical protein